MKNANKPINPVFNSHGFISNMYCGDQQHRIIGLTKREYFAGLAMQGLLSNPHCEPDPELLATASLDMADTLLEELEDEKA